MRADRFKGKIEYQDVFLARIDKRKARNLFNKGVKIYLVPSNLVPFGPWMQPHEINNSFGLNFDNCANVFSYYNCINSQTGYFPSFYINLLSI
jgi:hypothetical protein